MYKMFTDGFPHLPAGVGLTRKEAILNFVNQPEVEAKTKIRMIFNQALGGDLERFLENDSAERAFELIRENGGYGKFFLESEEETENRLRNEEEHSQILEWRSNATTQVDFIKKLSENDFVWSENLINTKICIPSGSHPENADYTLNVSRLIDL